MTTVRDLAATGVVALLLLLVTTQSAYGFICNTHGNFCIDKTHYGVCVELEDGSLLADETQMLKCVPVGAECVATSQLPCELPSVQPPTTPAEATEFTCTEAGNFPYPEDCTKYNKCYKLFFKLRHKVSKCFLGFGFSAEKSKCVLKKRSDCTVSSGSESDFELGSSEEGNSE